MSKITLHKINNAIKKFVEERDWSKYHSPKNISMSIAIEAAELMEHFQWLTIEQSKKLLKNKHKREEVEDELADIAIYILDFCNAYNIDLGAAVIHKLEKNSKKYPIKKSKGSAKKYTDL